MFELDKDLEIKTARLFIRLFQPQNITDKYLAALNDGRIMGLTESRHQQWNKEKAIKFILHANRLEKSILFGVNLVKGLKPIGNIRLFNFHRVHNRAELSFLFYDMDEWGKGYATESLKAVIKYAFEILKLHRIHADYYEVNSASARIFEKLGFSVEGIYKQHFWLNDNFIDSVRVAKIARPLK